MQIKEVEIINEMGLHARSAAEMVKLASKYGSKIEIEYKDMKTNAKSILGMMSLGVRKGERVVLYADGKDEEEAVEALENLIKEKFYEGN